MAKSFRSVPEPLGFSRPPADRHPSGSCPGHKEEEEVVVGVATGPQRANDTAPDVKNINKAVGKVPQVGASSCSAGSERSAASGVFCSATQPVFHGLQLRRSYRRRTAGVELSS